MSDDEVRFGRFRFHLGRRQLFRDDSPVRLGGRALDVLHTLVAAKGDVVSKQELFERVWPGLVVEENNLQVQVSLLRKTLETGDESHLVTVPGRGYRLVGLNETKPDPRLPDKPSIAVLPFQNLSDAPNQEYFAEGMVEEIVTALSCIKWLFVIDRNSTAVYKGRTVSVKQITHELGVRYVLEGAVRRASNRVRITAQLIDADTGANLWAGRFDKHLQDVFQLQDDIAASVAGVIEPTLEAAETRRSVRRPTADLTPMTSISVRDPASLLSS